MINPNMMIWAREYAGFVDEYEDLLPGYIKKNYKSWETGAKYPTWNQLRQVSKKYNVPTAFFFLNSIPKDDDLPELVNYRTFDSRNYRNKSPNLIKELRKSEYRRENYLDLLFELGEKIPKFEKTDIQLNKKQFAEYIREKLDIQLDTQKGWIKKNNSIDNKHYNFLNKWKETITKKMGILIFETDGVSIDEMRALCIYHEEVPIILLNGKDSVNGRIFSLFHELTHLLLGESAICGDNEASKVEIFCNAVAGEFLVPKDDLINNIKLNEISSQSINDLTHLYGVSAHVILRRLYDTNNLSKKDYDTRIENLKDHTTTKGNGGHFFNNVLKYNSETYCAVALEAYESGIISSGEFYELTSLKRQFIPNLQKRLFGDEQ
jgi:Zn-dependent peptidase ImmA (M78 family)